MQLELVTIAVLVLMFIIGTVRDLNMGVLGLAAAFAVGLAGVGMEVDDIFAGFPVDLFLALMGLTFLFGFAQQNGSIDLILQWSLRAVRGRVAAAPWIFFALAGLLMGIGAIFAIAVVAPLAIPFARKYRINQLMMGMMVVHGAMAGAFSPMSVYGVFINGFLAQQGIVQDRFLLFAASFVFNTVIAVILYVTLGGRSLLGRRIDGTDPADPSPSLRPDAYQLLTLVGLAAMAVGTAVFGLDIAVLSIGIGTLLGIINPRDAKTSLAGVSWGTAILVSGVVTYIHVLQEAGTVEFTSNGIAALGMPLLAILLLCYLGGVVSALASSIGTIGITVAIAAPLLAGTELNPVAVVAALAISATVVDVSPFSTNGAMVLANVDKQQQGLFFRQMMIYSGIIVALAPLAAWLAVFLPA